MTTSTVRLRDLSQAGVWGITFAVLALACFALVGYSAAHADYAWTFVLAGTGLVMLRELNDVLEEVKT